MSKRLGRANDRLQLFKKGGTSLLFGFSSYVLYDIAYMLVIQLLVQIYKIILGGL